MRILLKNFIIYCGVYIDYRTWKTILEALVELLHIKHLPQWPEGTAEGQEFNLRLRITLIIALLIIGQQISLLPSTL
jgi:hypothetical protein